ncbi:MAG: hypothetical protein WCC27_09255, partial [Acidobacteriaceae bacterium]
MKVTLPSLTAEGVTVAGRVTLCAVALKATASAVGVVVVAVPVVKVMVAVAAVTVEPGMAAEMPWVPVAVMVSALKVA